MNKQLVRSTLVLALGFAGTACLVAQEVDTTAKPKPAAKASSGVQGKAQAKPPVTRAAAEAKAVDINHASKAELKKLPGMTNAYVDAIIAKRPYKTKAELVIKNAIPMALFQTLRKQVAVK